MSEYEEEQHYGLQPYQDQQTKPRRTSIATIFNPRKPKGGVTLPPHLGPRPSVVVTDEDTPYPIQLTNGGEGLRGYATPRGSYGGRSGSFNFASFSHHHDTDAASTDGRENRKTFLQKLKSCVFSVTTRKILVGFVVTFCVTSSWVGFSHFIKDLYLLRSSPNEVFNDASNITQYLQSHAGKNSSGVFEAPFFASWFCTAWTGLFFPVYLICHTCCRREKTTVNALKNIAQSFRDRGVTLGKYFTRCLLFSILWAAINYAYIKSLGIMDSTDVMALYASHIAYAYLLAWVVLHQQFVGVRIVAVIMCNTGTALLAYMDGISNTQTLLAVVLSAGSSVGTSVFKVFLRKIVGESGFGQIGLFFSSIAFLSTLMFSPLAAVLILTGYENIIWEELPWPNCLLASALFFATNLFVYFGLAITFDIFITFGFILSLPVSGALDVLWYDTKFVGMKSAGIVLIACGFFLVLFPANWAQIITKLLRWGRHRKRHQHRRASEPIDYRTGLISRSHLRSPSGLIR